VWDCRKGISGSELMSLLDQIFPLLATPGP